MSPTGGSTTFTPNNSGPGYTVSSSGSIPTGANFRVTQSGPRGPVTHRGGFSSPNSINLPGNIPYSSRTVNGRTTPGAVVVHTPNPTQQEARGSIMIPTFDFRPTGKLPSNIPVGPRTSTYATGTGFTPNNGTNIKLTGQRSNFRFNDFNFTKPGRVSVSGNGEFNAYNTRAQGVHLTVNDKVRVNNIANSFHGAIITDNSINGNAFRNTVVRDSFHNTKFNNLSGNAFRNAQISGTSFKQAKFGSISGNAFRNARISGTSFKQAKFGSISGNAFMNSSISGNSFRQVQFLGKISGNAFRAANISGNSFFKADFTKATITGNAFRGARIYGNSFNQAKFGSISGNAFMNADIKGNSFRQAQFLGKISGNAFRAANISGNSFFKADFTKSAIAGNAFRNARISGNSFNKAKFGNIAGNAFMNADIRGNSFRQAQFLGKISGNAFRAANISGNSFFKANFTKATITGNAFRGAQILGNSFNKAKFGNIAGNAFMNSHISENSFRQAQFLGKINGNAFRAANISGNSFFKADFTKATITGNAFRNTQILGNSFNKAKFGNITGNAFMNADIKGNSFAKTQFLGKINGNAFRAANISGNSFFKADFTKSAIAGNAFRNTQIYGNSFNKAKFGNITGNAFMNADIKGNSFRQAQFLGKINGNAFRAANISGNSFFKADFKKVKITGNAFRDAQIHSSQFVLIEALKKWEKGNDITIVETERLANGDIVRTLITRKKEGPTVFEIETIPNVGAEIIEANNESNKNELKGIVPEESGDKENNTLSDSSELLSDKNSEGSKNGMQVSDKESNSNIDTLLKEYEEALERGYVKTEEREDIIEQLEAIGTEEAMFYAVLLDIHDDVTKVENWQEHLADALNSEISREVALRALVFDDKVEAALQSDKELQEQTIDILLSMLEDEDIKNTDIERFALMVLKDVKTPRAIDIAIDILKRPPGKDKDEESARRASLSEAIGILAQSSEPHAFEALLSAVDDSDRITSMEAAIGIKESPFPDKKDAIDKIINLLNHQDDFVNDIARAVLAEVITIENISLLAKKEIRQKISDREFNEIINKVLIRELQNPSTGSKKEAVDFLFKLGKEDVIEGAAIDFIKQFAQKEHVAQLVEQLKGSLYYKKSFAETLKRLGWQPQNVEDKAIFYGSIGEWEKVGELGLEAIKVLEQKHLVPDDIEYFKALAVIDNEVAREILLKFTEQYPGTDIPKFLGELAKKEDISDIVKIMRNKPFMANDLVPVLKKLGWQPQNIEEKVLYHVGLNDWETVGQLGLAGFKFMEGTYGIHPTKEYYQSLVASGDKEILQFAYDSLNAGGLHKNEEAILTFLATNGLENYSLSEALEVWGMNDISADEINSFAKKLELNSKNLSFSDFFLLVEVARSPYLQFFAEDKWRIIGELEYLRRDGLIVPRHDEFNRVKFGQGVLRPTPPSPSGIINPEEQKRQDQLKERLGRYDKNPIVEELTPIQLLRLYTVREAIWDSEMIAKLGEQIRGDIKNKTTEFGGKIVITSRGRLKLIPSNSSSRDNGSFRPSSNDNSFASYLFSKGILVYHFHALEEDCSKYAHPSGFFTVGNIEGGDYTEAKVYRHTGVVFTSMGYPKNSQGKEDKTKLVLNTDMYWVDSQGEPRFFDVGTTIISNSLKK